MRKDSDVEQGLATEIEKRCVVLAKSSVRRTDSVTRKAPTIVPLLPEAASSGAELFEHRLETLNHT